MPGAEEQRHGPHADADSPWKEGLERGRSEGKRATLRHQVQARFGALPPALDEPIAAGDEAALDGMIDRVILVGRVEDL